VTVVTLGPAEAEEQLRSCLALGASAAVLLETPAGAEFGPAATAAALHSVTADGGFDLVLLGNEAADTGDYQVGIRLAHLLGWPVATGIKALTVDDEGTSAAARREYRGVAETYALPLPCVLTVREGINLPRYPSLPGRLRAKRAVISRVPVSSVAGAALRTTALRVPAARVARLLCWGTASTRWPPWCRCSRSSGCCHDGVLPGGSRRRRRGGRLAQGADPRARRGGSGG
jgi:electron transfer flavoprotein beta subunit